MEIISLSNKMKDLLKRIFSSKILYILFSITLSITVLSEILFQNKRNRIDYMIFFMYIFILAFIGLTNLYLLLRLYRSINDLNKIYKAVNLDTAPSVSIILLLIIISGVYFAVLYFIDQSICGYVFDEKVRFAWQTKMCAYICVCFITSLSISLLLFYIYYVIFLNKILISSCKNCTCIYPVSQEIFYKVKKEISVANYIYWFTITAYIFFVFFHLYVYNGLNLTLQINNTNFEIVWIYIAFIALLGYFVFFYFPNKLIYDNVLKIKMQTIKEIEKINVKTGLYDDNLINTIQFVYNSPPMFNNYFLNKLFPTITTIITILISLLQLNKGAP